MLSTLKKAILGDYLPIYVISRQPVLFTSYWSDFFNNRSEILSAMPEGRIYAVCMLGWHRETDERADELATEVAAAKQESGNLRAIFLCNSLREETLLKARGLEATYCHQNAFLDERRYRVMPNAQKRYDAIYIARVTPFKRHELARDIPSLRLIGDYFEREKAHYETVMHALPQASWKRKAWSSTIFKEINQAHTGLCLSAEEGAMFVSAEYLLCGIPVVNTPNLGGRDGLFDTPYSLTVEPSAAAVAKGVAVQKSANFDPTSIRAAIVGKMEPHRERFKSLLRSLLFADDATADVDQLWHDSYIHKLGIRCSIPLGLRRQRWIRRGHRL
jgi:hypothetical protein